MKKIISVVIIAFLFFSVIQKTHAIESEKGNLIIELMKNIIIFGNPVFLSPTPEATPLPEPTLTTAPTNPTPTTSSQSTITPNPNITSDPDITPGTTPGTTPPISADNKVYFAQCNGSYDNLPLPNGCTFCRAGCGAATLSMVASSYLGPQYDPKTVVGIYKSKGYYLGCSGSLMSNAYTLLNQLGVKTTTYLVFNSARADVVVPRLKEYLDTGWTFFTLASFCSSGCGHFFWITDVDSNNNIWAYDPYYGRFTIPFNENSRYPYPLYGLAFGVKK